MNIISILIPVYNVERYLKKCLDSIIAQSLQNIEIICIDDGSTDNCPQILDDYAKKDDRIRVIHKVNEGYGKAMNTGLDLALGEYIGIVESDDWIQPKMFETLYNTAISDDYDIVKSNYYNVWECLDYYIKIAVNIYRTFDRNLVLFDPPSIWTGIYKKSFLTENHIRFNESSGASYQDTGFWIITAMCAKKVKFIDKTFYMYRHDNPSSSVKNKEKIMTLSREYDFIENWLIEHNKKNYIPICNYLRLRGNLETYNRIDDSYKLSFSDYIKQDYEKRKNAIDASMFVNCEYVLNIINDIAVDPKSYYEQNIESKRKLESKIKNIISKYSHIIIYGTGHRAIRIVLQLFDLLLLDKIYCAALTEPDEQRIFMSFPVYSISDLKDHKDTLVLIAVKKASAAFDEIVETLNELGFSNYIDTEMFLNL